MAGPGRSRRPTGRRGAGPGPMSSPPARPRRARGARLGRRAGRGPAGGPLAGPARSRGCRGCAGRSRCGASELFPHVRYPALPGQRRRRAPRARAARRGGVRRGVAACRCWCGPSTPARALRYWTAPRPGLAGDHQPARSVGRCSLRGPVDSRILGMTDRSRRRKPSPTSSASPTWPRPSSCRPTTRDRSSRPWSAGRPRRPPTGRCCTSTASPTTSSRPGTPSGGPSAATTSTPSTCASTAARCARTRPPTTSPTSRSYFPELDAAWSRDHRARRAHHVVLTAHSTGGLILPLWADDAAARPSSPGWCSTRPGSTCRAARCCAAVGTAGRQAGRRAASRARDPPHGRPASTPAACTATTRASGSSTSTGSRSSLPGLRRLAARDPARPRRLHAASTSAARSWCSRSGRSTLAPGDGRRRAQPRHRPRRAPRSGGGPPRSAGTSPTSPSRAPATTSCCRCPSRAPRRTTSSVAGSPRTSTDPAHVPARDSLGSGP